MKTAVLCYLMVTVSALVAFAADKTDISDVLEIKVSLRCEATTLESALHDLEVKVQAQHPDFAIKIIAKDLMAEGITRNQFIRDASFDDLPVADILTGLVAKGDPNSRSKGPADPLTRLIWVVGTGPAGAKQTVILITTRAGAKQRGDKSPAVFERKPDK
jgi:hypothetical protein